MAKIEFQRGDEFNCPVEIFQFVFSDWSVADKVTGGKWNVKKHNNTVSGGMEGFWAKFALQYPLEFKNGAGTFKYYVTLGGKLIHGSGMLEIKYRAVDENFTYNASKIDLEVKGFLSTLLLKYSYYRTLQILTDRLVKDQLEACKIIAKDSQTVMKLLSNEQKNELNRCLEKIRKGDTFESTLEIIPHNSKCSLEFVTSIPKYHRVKEDVELKETYPEFLDKFNNLIERGNTYCTISRSTENSGKIEDASRDFNQDIKNLGNALYNKYISNTKIGSELNSMFDYPKKANFMVRIEAEGYGSLLPWELLHDGDDFLCLKSSTYRAELDRNKSAENELGIEGVLVVASNPLDDLPNVEHEGKVILNSIKNISGIKTKLLSGDDASKGNVIREIETGEYQVLHYSGHSKFEERAPGSSYLLFEDGKHLMADELARLSRKNDLKLVFLNSCSSGASATENDLFNIRGLASAFVKTGVPYVIGMKWRISDEGATLLSKKFYEIYILDKDPMYALRISREYVGYATDGKDPAWASPVIYAA